MSDTETNSNGNTVAHRFRLHWDRYKYDFDICGGTGWQQYDTQQDASYFGVWVHLENRVIVTYAEGDEYTCTCEDDAHLAAELADMAILYGDPPPWATVIGDDGSVTELYDTRPALPAADGGGAA